jgi:hypothetical protein
MTGRRDLEALTRRAHVRGERLEEVADALGRGL